MTVPNSSIVKDVFNTQTVKITKKLNLYVSPSYKLISDILRQGTHANNLFKATQGMPTPTFMPSLLPTVTTPSGKGIF